MEWGGAGVLSKMLIAESVLSETEKGVQTRKSL